MWIAGAAVVAAVLFAVLCVGTGSVGNPFPSQSDRGGSGRQSAIGEVEPDLANPKIETSEPSEAEADESEGPMTDEERAEAEQEKLVDAFDALTDKWQEPSEKGVTMADVNAFTKHFNFVPQDRKEECLQRALNLVPDENVMLLVAILMDKTQDRELVELVFNDILNRDEAVKNPILQQVLKDKTHPCWRDAAWILDVQGENPANS